MKQDAAPVLDPPRLLGGGTTLERGLLQSARWDAAPAGARERMAAVLGPVLADPRALPGMEKATRGEWLRAAFRPRAALGLAGAGITAYLLASLLSRPGAVSDAASPGEPAAVSSGLPLAPAPDEHPVSTGGPPALEPTPDLTQGAPVLQESAPQRRHRPPSVKLAPAGSNGTLLEEVRLLDAIRSALRAGQPLAASHALGQYDQRFPRGELHNEKSVLALDLLLAKGLEGPARVRAKELLLQPGMQRYAAHLRAIAESSSAEGSSGSGSDTGDAHIRGRR